MTLNLTGTNLLPNDPNGLDFSKIERDWTTLTAAIELKLEREFPERLHEGAGPLLWTLVKVARNTEHAVRFLCADTPQDLLRPDKLVMACPPLVRQLADTLFTVIFILEDISQRVEWYFRAGWRERTETLRRYTERYADRPEWKEHLTEQADELERLRQRHHISDTEAADIKTILYWPTPGQMVANPVDPGRGADSRQFMQYLNDWFYRELSQATHGTWAGLIEVLQGLVQADKRKRGESDKMIIRRFRSTQVFMSVAIMLSICCEIDRYFGYGFSERTEVLWKVLSNESMIAMELYEERYGHQVPPN